MTTLPSTDLLAMTTNTTAIIFYVLALVVCFGLYYARKIRLWVLVVLLMLLGINLSTYEINRNTISTLHQRGVQSCEDRIKIADSIDTGFGYVREQLLTSAARVEQRLKKGKKGTAQYRADERLVRRYRLFASKLKIVRVKDCDFVLTKPTIPPKPPVVPKTSSTTEGLD